MSRRKERKVTHDDKSWHDAFEGTSARTRPYSFQEIMHNRKNKKVSQDPVIEAGSKQDNVDRKLELLQTDDDEKSRKCSSHDERDQKTENIREITSRTKERRISLKLESVIVGNDSVSREEKKVKSKVVSNTRHKETIGKRYAKDHKLIEEDETHYNTRDNPVGYSPLKNSSSKRSGDYRNEKLERDVKRKEPNHRDQKSIDDYKKAEYKRKVNYTEGKDRFREEVEKAGRENKQVHRNDLSRKHSDKDIGHIVLKRDSKLSDRRERKRSPSPLREKPSKKSRRSSSREHKRDRDQKISLHEVHNHKSYNRQSHAVSSSQSFKDGSGKYASELDMSSKFTNGTNGHNKEYNEPTDKLGGYSPRKRRSEDPIQSPPRKGISGKKRVGWDTPQTESHITVSSTPIPIASIDSIQSKPSTLSHSVGILAVSSSHSQSSLLNVQSAIHIEPSDSVQLTQSTQPMRRLIIENVPSSVSEKDVMDCLNKYLLPTGANFIKGTQPCFSCLIHAEKRQALVEFLTAEYASAALSFKGSPLLGSDFKIRRPKDFVAVETVAHEKSVAVVNAVSDIVEDSPHKIFIGGISRNITPKMLTEIVSAFGPLKAFKFLVKNDADEPRAFLQYVDQSVTAKACAGLNGMKLGSQTLTVIQANTNKPSSDIKCPPTYEIPDTAMPLLADPTEVLVLKNVFDHERFSSLSETEIQEVLEDVRLECTRFGSVKSINVIASTQSSTASLEINERGAAKSPPTDSTGYHSDCGGSKSKVGSSKEMEKEDYGHGDFMKSDNLNAEEHPTINIADSNNVNSEEKQGASDCILNTELFSVRSGGFDKSSSLVDETGNANYEAEGNIGGHDLISVGENRHSLSLPTKPDCNTETIVEVNKENKESSHLVDELGSVLMPGSICIEYRRSEATCSAAHCFHGRAFDNRIVSVEYLSLDLYRRKFPL